MQAKLVVSLVSICFYYVQTDETRKFFTWLILSIDQLLSSQMKSFPTVRGSQTRKITEAAKALEGAGTQTS